MTPSFERFLTWAPRVLCLLFAAFVGLFAPDAFEPARGLGANLLAFAIHLTPMFVVIALLAIGWRWPRVAGALLIAAGCVYVWRTPARQHLSWIAVIAGPAWLTGVMFLLSPAAKQRL